MMVLALAFLIDLLVGDPPNRFHPVAWMGSDIAWYRRTLNHSGKAWRFLAGLFLVVLGSTFVATVDFALQRICQLCPLAVSILIQAVVLKCTFSARSLARAASLVADALNAGNLPLARQQIAYHLVSRDVSSLDASEIAWSQINQSQIVRRATNENLRNQHITATRCDADRQTDSAFSVAEITI